MSVYELIMLLCFGAAWPFSIYNSARSRSTKGKSFGFLIILMAGYVSGIINKILYHYDFVIYLYVINLLMVGIDAALWLRNKREEGRKMSS